MELKMKKKMETAAQVQFMVGSNVIAFASIAISVLSLVWLSFVGYGKLNGRVDAVEDDVKEMKAMIIRMDEKWERRFDKIDERFDKLETKMNERFEKVNERFDKMESKIDALAEDLHHVDVRVAKIEQRKP